MTGAYSPSHGPPAHAPRRRSRYSAVWTASRASSGAGSQRDALQAGRQAAALDELVGLRGERGAARRSPVPSGNGRPATVSDGGRRIVGEEARVEGVAEHVRTRASLHGRSYCPAMSGSPSRAVVEDRRRLPDLSAQLRRRRRRRDRRPRAGSPAGWTTSPRSASTCSGCPRSTRRRRTTTATTSATTRTSTRRSARSADFDALLAAVHERGMKLVMDLVVNHTSDEHPWFVESRAVAGQPEARLVLVAPAARGHGRRATRAPSRRTGARSSPARPGSSTRRRGEYYLHLFSRKQPDLNWENPEVRAGGLRDDALVAGPRRRRLPHGRHQHDLQGHRRCPTATCAPAAATATARRTSSAGRASTSSCRRCTARSSPAATGSCSPSARCPA